MAFVSASQWNSLERWSATLFLIGGVMFIVAAAFEVANVVVGVEDLRRGVGQAFIDAGWIAALIGLLGLYPKLADRSRWLIRAAGVFAVIGVVGLVGHGVTALVPFVRGVSPAEAFPLFILAGTLIGVMIGCILSFVSFSIACLRSDVHSRTVGILLLVPTLIFITNFFILPAMGVPNPRPSEVSLFVVTGLALTMLAIGTVLRTDFPQTDSTEPALGQTTE